MVVAIVTELVIRGSLLRGAEGKLQLGNDNGCMYENDEQTPTISYTNVLLSARQRPDSRIYEGTIHSDRIARNAGLTAL